MHTTGRQPAAQTAPARLLRLVRMGSLLLATSAAGYAGATQAPVPSAAPAASAIGTVKDISGNTLTLTLANSQTLTVQASDGARVMRLAPGSSNLKAADPIAFPDIAVGDRVLVRGPGGNAQGTFSASLLVVMKAQDIQQKQAADLQDWQRRGTGGLVQSVDPAAGTISISTMTAAGAGKLTIQTTPQTIYRRYAPDSVKFEDARLGKFSDLKKGDQLRVRGTKSTDGAILAADEIVSGTFLNIAGTVSAVDVAASTLTVHDLVTGKTITLRVSTNTSLHTLPPAMAAMFAMRLRTAAAASAGANAGGAAGGVAAVAPEARSPRPSALPGAAGGSPAPDGSNGFQGHGAGAGLSQAIARSPVITLSDLKPNDAVMVVATQGLVASGDANASGGAQPSAANAATVVTLLSGVEPILAAVPANGRAMTLSPWTMGGDMPTE